MLNFALMGAGRIGKMHAKNIAMHSKCNLSYIFDINQDLANEVAKQNKVNVVQSADCTTLTLFCFATSFARS